MPRFTPALSAHWVGYITDVPADIARPVIDGMYSEAVCRDDRIAELVPFDRTPFDLSLSRALAERAAHGRPVRLWAGRALRPLEGRVLRPFGAPGRAGAPRRT
jgi:hypothetical protein